MKTEYFCLTVNNTSIKDQDDFINVTTRIPNLVYCIGQLEEGDIERTRHLQAYACLTVRKQVSAAIKLFQRYFPGAHVEPRRGNHLEAKAYCSKPQETFIGGPWEYGCDDAIPKVQGTDRTRMTFQEYNEWVLHEYGHEAHLHRTSALRSEHEFDMLPLKQ